MEQACSCTTDEYEDDEANDIIYVSIKMIEKSAMDNKIRVKNLVLFTLVQNMNHLNMKISE